jgi:hypothetical protein
LPIAQLSELDQNSTDIQPDKLQPKIYLQQISTNTFNIKIVLLGEL